MSQEIKPLSPETVLEQLKYNAHDMGEMGSFIRLEYAENILRSSLASVLLWAAEQMPEKHSSDELPFDEDTAPHARNMAIEDCEAALIKMAEDV